MPKEKSVVGIQDKSENECNIMLPLPNDYFASKVAQSALSYASVKRKGEKMIRAGEM